jgi:signal transduction histidine kinase
VAVHSQANVFSLNHLRLLESAANWTAIAIGNARLFAEVNEGRARLEALAQQIVTAQEEERRRVAIELHDEAGQALTALKMRLELLLKSLPLDSPLKSGLLEAVEIADETSERIRLLSHDLHPPALEELGLNALLDSFCQDFGRRTGLECAYRGQDDLWPPRLMSLTFYRLLQEALTNAVKHGRAGQARVALTYEGAALRLVIQDNGVGFDLASRMVVQGQPGGIGLLGMQERFRLAGGWVEIDSAPGQGTTIRGVIPFAR